MLLQYIRWINTKQTGTILLLLAKCCCALSLAVAVVELAAVVRALVAGVAVVGQVAVGQQAACLGRGLRALQALGVLLGQASSRPDSHRAAEQGRRCGSEIHVNNGGRVSKMN